MIRRLRKNGCLICGAEAGTLCDSTKHFVEKTSAGDETGKGYRQFSTGATRDTAIGKIDPARYVHPAVVKAFATYMYEKQSMPDGTVRAGDNWQKGIPPEELMSSLARHYLDIWLHLKGESALATEPLDRALNGARFNVDALHLHLIKGTLSADKQQ